MCADKMKISYLHMVIKLEEITYTCGVMFAGKRKTCGLLTKNN